MERYLTDTRVLEYTDVFHSDAADGSLASDKEVCGGECSCQVNEDVVCEIVRVIRMFHSSHIVLDGVEMGMGSRYIQSSKHHQSSILWHTIYGFYKTAIGLKCDETMLKLNASHDTRTNTQMIMDVPSLRAEIQELEHYCNTFDTFEMVFTHNDLLMGNFLLPKWDAVGAKTIRLIDFEYSCYGHLCYDFANMFNEFAGFECHWHKVPSKEAMRIFLKHYFTNGTQQEECIETSSAENDTKIIDRKRTSKEEKIDLAMREIEVYRLVR